MRKLAIQRNKHGKIRKQGRTNIQLKNSVVTTLSSISSAYSQRNNRNTS